MNEAKDRVDFIYEGYNLRGSIQLQENKVRIEGKIPPYVPSKFSFLAIRIANLLAGEDTTKSINNSREDTESNLEDTIMGESERIFN